MNVSINSPVSHTTASEPPAEIPIRQESESVPQKREQNRKFPGPSLQEQRNFLNGFNREEYYKKYVR